MTDTKSNGGGVGGAIDYRVTSLLTEHFGFPPLALIDDVINAVNEIMYTCTTGIETYLKEKQTQAFNEISEGGDSSVLIDDDSKRSVFTRIPEDEIAIGTGKLETLLENQVDKNFDKFELYTLRNIMMLPQDLIEEGWIKLKHHENVQFLKNSEIIHTKSQLDDSINKLIINIKLELQLRQILRLQILKTKKILITLREFKNQVNFLNHNITSTSSSSEYQLSQPAKDALKALSPIDETLYFILKQVDDLIKQTQSLAERINHDSTLTKIKFIPNLRDRYIDNKAFQLLEKVGMINRDELQSQPEHEEVEVVHEDDDDAMEIDDDEDEVEEEDATTTGFRITSQNHIPDIDDGNDTTLGSNFIPDMSLTTELEAIKNITDNLNEKQVDTETETTTTSTS
ncbi:Mis12 protein-domain-containing protein [Scheffersomyces coipomensis]|uniref:Mis12 protein-domain-containing protein n=1 Tax=Scheffersomyces coipomensis TaxID=1788519 RepID=UPI00315C7806